MPLGSAVQTLLNKHDAYRATILGGTLLEPESWPKKEKASNWILGLAAVSSILERHLSKSTAFFSCMSQPSRTSLSMHCMILVAIRNPSAVSSSSRRAFRSHRTFKHVICIFLYKSLVEPNNFCPDGVTHCCMRVWVDTGCSLALETCKSWIPSGCSTIMTMPHSHRSSMADSPETLFCKIRHSSVSKRRLVLLGRRR